MSWERWRADNLAGWDNRVDIHAGPEGYDLAALLSDSKSLSSTVQNDQQALGSLSGLDVVHLQCHLGSDTLSLMRLGAKSVTGLDFSPKAISHCQSLFSRAGAPGRFIQGDVYDAAALLNARFDLVYASIGVINWIPSISRWMEVAADLLRPGGRLYLRDVHPMSMVIDPETDLELRLRYAYGETVEPVTLDDEQTYTGDGKPLHHATTHEWSHGMGEIVPGALDAGLRIEGLREHYFTKCRMLPSMVREAPGRFVLPDRPERLPLLFTLKASKPAKRGR